MVVALLVVSSFGWQFGPELVWAQERAESRDSLPPPRQDEKNYWDQFGSKPTIHQQGPTAPSGDDPKSTPDSTPSAPPPTAENGKDVLPSDTPTGEPGDRPAHPPPEEGGKAGSPAAATGTGEEDGLAGESAPETPQDEDKNGEETVSEEGETPAELREAERGIEALFRLGRRAQRKGQWKKAERHFLAVLEKAPYHFHTRLRLGQLYLMRNPLSALEHLKMARRIVPSDPTVHYFLGQALEGLGRDLDAAEAFRQAIYRNPRHYNANNRLRAILRRLRAGKSVVQRAAEAFQASPSLASLTLFGQIVMEHVDPRAAVLEFERVRDLAPELAEVDLWLARAWRAAGDPAGESEAYFSYLKTHPTAAGVRLLLVERMIGQGRIRNASELLEPMEPAQRGPNQGTPSRLTLGRATFLQSRILSARQEPARAGEKLLQAQENQHDPEVIAAAFKSDLDQYPQAALLWFSYARWLRRGEQLEESAEAFMQAGLLDAGQRPRVRVALQEMLEARSVQSSGSSQGDIRPRDSAQGDTRPRDSAQSDIRPRDSAQGDIRPRDSAQGDIRPRDSAQGDTRPAAHFALGALAFADKEHRAALAHLDHVSLGHRLDPRAALLRGRIHRALGEDEAAFDAFLRYILHFQNRSDLIWARGNLYWELGRTSEALAVWAEEPDVLIRHPQVLLRKAEHHRLRGEVAEEIASRERLLQGLPGNQDNRIRLGALYQSQGRRREGLKLWEETLAHRPYDHDLLISTAGGWVDLGETARGLEWFQKASELKVLAPKDAELLGRALFRENRYEDALAVYWPLYGTNPGHPDLPRVLPVLALSVPAEPEVRRVAARLARRAGRADQAAELLEALLQEAPRDQQARETLAVIYLDRNRPDLAVNVLTDPLAFPGTGASGSEGLRLLARVQERAARWPDLAKTLALLHEREPENHALARRRGLLLARLGRHDEARPFLEGAIAQDPGDAGLRLAIAQGAQAGGDSAKAIEHLRVLLADHPGHEAGRRALIDLLMEEGRWSEVPPQLEAWLADHPGDSKARYNLITAYLKEFQPNLARPHYNILRESSPRHSRTLAPYFP